MGQILIEMNLILERQLEQALEEQHETGQFLGEILIAHGWLTRTALGKALRVQRDLLVEPEPGLGGGIQARDAGSEPHGTIGRPVGTWLAQGARKRGRQPLGGCALCPGPGSPDTLVNEAIMPRPPVQA